MIRQKREILTLQFQPGSIYPFVPIATNVCGCQGEGWNWYYCTFYGRLFYAGHIAKLCYLPLLPLATWTWHKAAISTAIQVHVFGSSSTATKLPPTGCFKDLSQYFKCVNLYCDAREVGQTLLLTHPQIVNIRRVYCDPMRLPLNY